MDPYLGTVIAGKYRLTQFLGEGGLGQVFLAQQQPLGRKVALKLLHPEFSSDASISARFEREAKAASQVAHPNSVVIHDFGTDQQRLYLVMEYLSGETLHQRIQQAPKRRLPAWEAVHLLSRVLRPLEAFHKAGVIHRDLKPDNIMICKAEGEEQVKLLDFGIAKVNGSSLTATGQLIGTPHYMAPEQIAAKKDLGPTVDIYAMGVLLYEALAGDPPYMEENHMDIFRKHLSSSPPPLGEKFPREKQLAYFDAVIAKAMAKRPQERYQSAEEMREAVEDALASSEQERTTITPPPKKAEPLLFLEEEVTTIHNEETVKMESLSPGVKQQELVVGFWLQLRRFLAFWKARGGV